MLTQYENIEDEDEGFKIEEIEKYYNSDEESESKCPLHQLLSVLGFFFITRREYTRTTRATYT